MDEPAASEQLPAEPAAAGGEPAVTDSGEPGYRIVCLRVGADGRVEVRLAAWMSPRVFTREVATKCMAENHARKTTRGEAVFVLLDTGYRAVAVLLGGSGRAASPHIAARARRMVAKVYGERRVASRASRPPRARASRPVTTKARR